MFKNYSVRKFFKKLGFYINRVYWVFGKINLDLVILRCIC